MSADEKKGKSLTLEEKDRLVDEMRHSGLTQQAWSDERGYQSASSYGVVVCVSGNGCA